MRLLVLGGTRFVGRALVAQALARGWQVTALNRGTRSLPDGARLRQADRTDEGALRTALQGRSFDGVVDTWAGAPRVARLAAEVVEAEHRAYVSSCSVYVWEQHVDESSPVVEGSPDAGETDYAADKRGGELAWDRALWLRAGLILGPREDIGRLPWWLSRISRGGRVVAPGRADRPLQYVDARDLAALALDRLGTTTGPVDVTSLSGHATTRTLLAACVAATGSDAELVWVPEERLAAAGVEPWTQLPCWVPETGEWRGFLEADARRAQELLGLVCRPVEETVADTWAWLQRNGMPAQRPDRAVHGLPEDLERSLLFQP